MNEIDRIFLDEMEKYKKLLIHEELLIELSKRNYHNAKIKLGQAKQGLVLNICLDYLGNGLKFMELINEANAGLYEGIEEINNFHDGNLNDFLKGYIEVSLKRALDNKQNE